MITVHVVVPLLLCRGGGGWCVAQVLFCVSGVVRVSFRPSDWSAVGRTVDPTPGDPVVVADGATRYRQVADAINRCAQNLRALEAGASQAESVTALLESRDTIVDGVVGAENRYRVAADALDSYAQVLDRVQTDTVNALYAAKDAVTDRDEANRMKAHYQSLADEHHATTNTDDGGGDDGSYAHYTRLCHSCGADADAAQSRIDAQIQIVDQAVADRDRAAQQAIDAIETVTAADGLNDSWWDDWGATLTTWIARISEAVAAIAGILALLVCWIPVIGQALAAALLSIAAIAGIIAAVANIILAATGEQSWGHAIVSIVFAALGCVGLGGLRGVVGGVRGLARVGGAWTGAGGLAGVGARTLTVARTGASSMAGLLAHPVATATGAASRAAHSMSSLVAELRAGRIIVSSGEGKVAALFAERESLIAARNRAEHALADALPDGYTLTDFTRTKIDGTLEHLGNNGVGQKERTRLATLAGELSSARAGVTGVSERIGEVGGWAHLDSLGASAVPSFTASSPGRMRIDGLAVSADAGTLIVGEFKGVTSTLSTRPVATLLEGPACQGSAAYTRDRMLRDPRLAQFFADSPPMWNKLVSGELNLELRVIYTQTPTVTRVNVLPFDMTDGVLAELTTRVNAHLHP